MTRARERPTYPRRRPAPTGTTPRDGPLGGAGGAPHLIPEGFRDHCTRSRTCAAQTHRLLVSSEAVCRHHSLVVAQVATDTATRAGQQAGGATPGVEPLRVAFRTLAQRGRSGGGESLMSTTTGRAALLATAAALKAGECPDCGADLFERHGLPHCDQCERTWRSR